MSELNWYAARNGQQVGPFPLAALRSQAAAGQLQADDLVWAEGMTDWVAARRVPEVAAALGIPPAPQTTPGVSAQPTPQAPHAAPYTMPYAMPAYQGTRLPIDPRFQAYVHFGGFWIRFVAAFLDGLILLVPSMFVNAAITGNFVNTRHTQVNLGSALLVNAIGIVIGWLYEAMFTASEYQATPGKLAVGLRVTDLSGNTISFARATGRHFAKMVSSIILGIGYIMAAFDDQKRGLHDRMCSTLVTYKNA